jgi:hypothetical protein
MGRSISRLLRNAGSRQTPPMTLAKHPEGAPLHLLGLMAQRFLQGEGRVFLGVGGA